MRRNRKILVNEKVAPLSPPLKTVAYSDRHLKFFIPHHSLSALHNCLITVTSLRERGGGGAGRVREPDRLITKQVSDTKCFFYFDMVDCDKIFCSPNKSSG